MSPSRHKLPDTVLALCRDKATAIVTGILNTGEGHFDAAGTIDQVLKLVEQTIAKLVQHAKGDMR